MIWRANRSVWGGWSSTSEAARQLIVANVYGLTREVQGRGSLCMNHLDLDLVDTMNLINQFRRVGIQQSRNDLNKFYAFLEC